MPRYFINTFNSFEVRDDEGTVLPDVQALATMLRDVLADMVRDEARNGGQAEFRAEARDETGRRVMMATVKLLVAADA